MPLDTCWAKYPVGRWMSWPRSAPLSLIGRIRAARRRVAGLHRAPGAEERIELLRPPWWSSLRLAGEAVLGTVSERYRSVAGDSDAVSFDELTGDDFSSVSEEKPKSPWLSPAVLAAVATAAASIVASRSLFGTSPLVGLRCCPPRHRWAKPGGLLGRPSRCSRSGQPAVACAGRTRVHVHGWPARLVDDGADLRDRAAELIAAYSVTRRLIESRRVRVWVAGIYALLPVLLGGTNQGRLSLSVLAVGLPLLVLAVRALVLRRVRTPEAWRGGWGAGVVLVLFIAFEPSMIIFSVLVAGLGAIALRRTPRKIGRIGIALAVPLVVLAPWWPTLIRTPGRLFVGPDSAMADAVTGSGARAPDVWQLFIGQGLGVGLPPLWLSAVVFGVLWLVALLGLAAAAASDHSGGLDRCLARAGDGGGLVPIGGQRAAHGYRGPALGGRLLAHRVRRAGTCRRSGLEALASNSVLEASPGCSRPVSWPGLKSLWSRWPAPAGGSGLAPRVRSTGCISTPSPRTC